MQSVYCIFITFMKQTVNSNQWYRHIVTSFIVIFWAWSFILSTGVVTQVLFDTLRWLPSINYFVWRLFEYFIGFRINVLGRLDIGIKKTIWDSYISNHFISHIAGKACYSTKWRNGEKALEVFQIANKRNNNNDGDKGLAKSQLF